MYTKGRCTVLRALTLGCVHHCEVCNTESCTPKELTQTWVYQGWLSSRKNYQNGGRVVFSGRNVFFRKKVEESGRISILHFCWELRGFYTFFQFLPLFGRKKMEETLFKLPVKAMFFSTFFRVIYLPGVNTTGGCTVLRGS